MKKPTLLNISVREWKIASPELKKQFEELDLSMMKIMSHLWAEEFQRYPEKAKLFEEV